MSKHKCINFKNSSLKYTTYLDTEKELEAKKSEDKETENEAEKVLDDRRVRGRKAEKVSDEKIEGDINSKKEKSVKERSFIWSHFKKITNKKNVI